MKTKKNKTIKTKKIESWKEITSEQGKKDFRGIIKILTMYSDMQGSSSPSHLFRKNLVNLENGFRVFLKKLGEFDFLVVVILENGNSENWIHVDGIYQERKMQSAQQNLEHPVFSIVCLTDIFENTEIVSTKSLLKILSKNEKD